MGAVTFQDEQFAQMKFDNARSRIGPAAPTTPKGKSPRAQQADYVHSDSVHSDSQQMILLGCLHHPLGLLQRSTYRVVLVGFVQTSLQLNLQISLLALQRASWGKVPDEPGHLMRPPEELGIIATFK